MESEKDFVNCNGCRYYYKKQPLDYLNEKQENRICEIDKQQISLFGKHKKHCPITNIMQSYITK